MRVVHIDDELETKIKILGEKINTFPVSDERELEKFLKTAAQDPGAAVVDVVRFHGLLKERMLEIGEDLADCGWQVIYWSSGVLSDNVREDCWFDDCLDLSAGAAAIAAAVNSGEFQ